MCLDFRPSSEKVLLLKSVRTLLRKMKKQKKILCHLVKIYYTPYVVKMHKKKHQIRPLSRKKINTSIEFFSM